MMIQAEGRYSNHLEKRDTIHSEVALPEDAPKWAVQLSPDAEFLGDRTLNGPAAVQYSERFWNAVEAADTRVNGQLARETQLALPRELTVEQNIALVRGFVAEQITSKGYVADWAFHLPDDAQHNPHVHIMTSLRPMTEAGFGPKSFALRDADGNQVRKKSGQLVMRPFAGGKPELQQWREAWQDHANVALAEAGFNIEIDHRSHEARGIDTHKPGIHHGPGGHIDKRGLEAEMAARNLVIQRENFQRFENDPVLVLKELSRQHSTFDDRDIARFIYRFAESKDEFDRLRLRVGALPELKVVQAEIHDPESNWIVQRARYTTDEVIQREARMSEAAIARLKDESFRPNARSADKALMRAEETQGFSYTAEQKAAIGQVTRPEGVTVLAGLAGAGKSTVLRAVADIYEADGRRVVGAALAGKAAEGLEASAGISSRTIASMERSWENGNGHLRKGDVLVLDEAGMVASAQMTRVIERVDGWSAKLILVGDSRQLQPIEAGAAFRAIADEVGYSELTEIRRQTVPWQAQASVEFGKGNAVEALKAYVANDYIQAHVSRDVARMETIASWSSDWEANVDTVMLAHANKDVLALNEMARQTIKDRGGLQDEAKFVTARGVRHFAEGDRIIFLENDRELGVKNGTIGTVEEAHPGRLTISVDHLDDPIQIDQQDYANIDHGYALTIHKTQGSTVDTVHLLATGSMDAQLTYVAMTRHRENVTMHIAGDTFRGIDNYDPSRYIEPLGRERLKDTTLSYAMTEDYRQSLFEAREGVQDSTDKPGGWLRRFVDIRGWAQPEEVRQSLRTYADRLRQIIGSGGGESQEIRVLESGVPGRNVPTVRPLPDVLEGTVARLDHVQLHSTRMGDQGTARRDALHMADHVMHDGRHAQKLREWAHDVSDIVAPTTVVAIGRDFDEPKATRLLGDLDPATVQSLRDNWLTVHAVSRAADDALLLDTFHRLDAGFKADRIEEAYERSVERGGPSEGTRIEPYKPEIPSFYATGIHDLPKWPDTTKQAVDRLVRTNASFIDSERRVVGYLGKVYRDPEAIWTSLRPRLEAGEAPSIASEVHKNLEVLGELRGSKRPLLGPDAERKEVLATASLMIHSILDHGQGYAVTHARYDREESLWRNANSRPLEPLSEKAQDLLARITESPTYDYGSGRDERKRLDLFAAYEEPEWQELQRFKTEIDKRFPEGRDPTKVPGLDAETAGKLISLTKHVNEMPLKAERHIAIERSVSQELSDRLTYGMEL